MSKQEPTADPIVLAVVDSVDVDAEFEISIELDPKSLLTLQRLHETHRISSEAAQILTNSAANDKSALDNYVQQLAQLCGIDKSTFSIDDWEIDLPNSMINKKSTKDTKDIVKK